MRTTLTLDDDLAEALKEKAYRHGESFKSVVNETLRAGLAAGAAPPKRRRYRVRVAALGGLRPGVELDKTLRLAGELEDDEICRKLDLRK